MDRIKFALSLSLSSSIVESSKLVGVLKVRRLQPVLPQYGIYSLARCSTESTAWLAAVRRLQPDFPSGAEVRHLQLGESSSAAALRCSTASTARLPLLSSVRRLQLRLPLLAAVRRLQLWNFHSSAGVRPATAVDRGAASNVVRFRPLS